MLTRPASALARLLWACTRRLAGEGGDGLDGHLRPGPARPPAMADGRDPDAHGASPPDPGMAAGEPADSAEFRLTVESLTPGEPPRMSDARRRALLNGLSIVAALALVAVVATYLRGVAPTPRPGPSPTPTPAAPRGWSIAGPAYAQTIVFAPSAPATAYTCGAEALDGPGAPPAVSVGISHDFGHTWTTIPTPWLSPWCDITVDPTDPRDVALMTEVCASCSANPSLSLYRSTDGGTFWRLWLLPPRPSDGRRDFTAYQWAWAGATLFIAPYANDAQRYSQLAASVDQRPFDWVGQHGLFAGEPQDTGINRLIGVGGTLYVTFDCGSGCPVESTHMMRSGDGGATWSLFAPTFRGRAVFLVEARPAAAGLLGFLQPGPATPGPNSDYVRSTDMGLTWQSLPPIPGGMGLFDIVSAPDGTVYAAFWDCCGPPPATAPPGIYKLAPGAIMWAFLGPFPGNAGGPITISWNAAGHPLALWGGAYPQTKASATTPGIERHQP
jgi:hypothetical protein